MLAVLTLIAATTARHADSKSFLTPISSNLAKS